MDRIINKFLTDFNSAYASDWAMDFFNPKETNLISISSLKDIDSYSGFKKNENGDYTRNFHLGENYNADMLDIEVDDNKKTLKLSYKYSAGNSAFASSITTFLPEDSDPSTMTAVFENGVLKISMKSKTLENKAQTVNITFK